MRESTVEEYLLRRVKEVLAYDTNTGVFHWRVARGRAPAGAVAGALRGDGYLAIRVDGVSYLAHRLAWLWSYGAWPQGEVDHKNGRRRDNRLTNLRDVPRNLNQQNQRRAQITNTARLLGVSRADSVNGFRARIFFKGRECHLGTFPTAEQAHAAYLSAKRAHHPGGTL